MPQCAAITRKGTRCRLEPEESSDWCRHHQPDKTGQLPLIIGDPPPPQPAPLPVGTLIYTDGSAKPNPGVGGWGWIRADGTGTGSGGEEHTTNQRMELKAALEAVTANPEPDLVIISDSRYLVDCFHQGWWRKWHHNDWQRGPDNDRQEVRHRDLWEPLIDQANRRGIRFAWVKGHSGNHWNEQADRLAEAAAKKLRTEQPQPQDPTTADHQDRTTVP